ncbi:VanZ family protein [Aestuariimicrobium soli]|uniref:VanZ family protein n=1 Tax=Aestuariimicrobium soli TaxID=2035834 RepID=UPI003EBF8BDD
MNRLLRHLLTLAFVGVTAVHLAGLYWPRVELPGDAPNTDKWVHLVAFGVPVALGWLRFRRHRWWLVAAFAAHGPLSELLQGTVLPHRSGDPLDAVADLVGVAVGVLVGLAGDTLTRDTLTSGKLTREKAHI